MYQSSHVISIFIVFLLTFNSVSLAEIYKYKDKNGRWQFSDKPVVTGNSSTASQKTTSTKKNTDIKVQLEKKFNPQSDIDKASLAVVKIKTRSGSGSGFFITSEGHIITNRHVVRPATSTGWEDQKAELENEKEKLDDYSSRLKDEQERLKEMKSLLEEDEEFLASRHAKDSDIERHKRYQTRYKRDMTRYEKNEKKYKTMMKDYKSKKSEFGWQSSVSNFSKKFTIVLKNNKEYKAKLVKISKEHDLALLKLDKYVTPYISLSKGNTSRQGDKVFAIGSPLGISDSLTSGIITKKDEDLIITDTRILPGNSGGPLVNTNGQLLGINTAAISKNKYADGLGLAIYAKYIRQEFSSKLRGKL